MNRRWMLWNGILIVAVLVGDLCYMEFGGLWLKSLTSLGFVLLGWGNLIGSQPNRLPSERRFPWILCLGLTTAMLGDILINLNFIAGALVFAAGHVLFFFSFCALMRFRLTDLIPGGILFALSAAILLLVPVFDFGSGLMQGVCLFYALIISLMLGKAIANLLRQRNRLTVLLTVGCLLFYFSDLMLVFDVFSETTAPVSKLCLLTYYPAQCLLAVGAGLPKASE